MNLLERISSASLQNVATATRTRKNGVVGLVVVVAVVGVLQSSTGRNFLLKVAVPAEKERNGVQ